MLYLCVLAAGAETVPEPVPSTSQAPNSRREFGMFDLCTLAITYCRLSVCSSHNFQSLSRHISAAVTCISNALLPSFTFLATKAVPNIIIIVSHCQRRTERTFQWCTEYRLHWYSQVYNKIRSYEKCELDCCVLIFVAGDEPVPSTSGTSNNQQEFGMFVLCIIIIIIIIIGRVFLCKLYSVISLFIILICCEFVVPKVCVCVCVCVCQSYDKKAMLSQRWPRDALWKISGVPDYAHGYISEICNGLLFRLTL